ncbi:hypothetical protein, partial [Parvimonas micra]|uniref:hypothetical protein n=1 Tax=Parvimonas micra TaxID=33033 RepID=UPI002B45FB00
QMLNLGAIQFSLGINFQGLDSANQRMQAFGRSVQGMQTAANRGFNTTITQMRRQENAVLSALEKVKRFTDQVNNSSLSPQVKLDQINAAHAAFDTLTKRVEGTRKTIDSTKFDRSIAGFNSAFNDLSRTFASAERTSQAA